MLSIEAKTNIGTSKIIYNDFAKEVRIIVTSFETLKHSINAKLYPNLLVLDSSDKLKKMENKYSERLKHIEEEYQEKLKLLLKDVAEDLEKFDTSIESQSQQDMK